ncbi:MAG: metal ABC transporter substrate-binding protein [Acidimicrobiia bacterium]
MRRALSTALGVAVLVAAAGATAPPAAAAREPLGVVAAFYPLAWAVEQVGAGNVKVSNLTPAGAEPHDLELTPDDRDAIEDARLVVVLGKGFQPAVEDAASVRDSGTLEVLEHLPIGVKGNRVDPHVWLDPVLMSDIVDDVAASLAKIDAKHAPQYRANARAVRADLEMLDAEFRAGLGDCERDVIVTAHEAFGYLADRYGLQQEGVAPLSPDAEPSPERLADLADLAEERGVTTIFTEELVSPKIAQTLAREAGGLETAVLSPLESLTDAQVHRHADYLSVMRVNLKRLQQALGCTSP